jgi:hypothetical protein
MVHFQTKNPDLGKFWRASQLNKVVYFKDIWSILRPIGIFCGHLVYLWTFGIFMDICYIFIHFGKSHQEKSGNPARQQQRRSKVLAPELFSRHFFDFFVASFFKDPFRG